MNNTIKKNLLAPCKNCPDRYVGCHSQCESYKMFRKLKDIENREIREGKRLEKASYSESELKDNFKNRFKR